LRRVLAALGVAACLSACPLSAGASEAASINRFYQGQCTWFAAEVRPDIGSMVRGNANQWLVAAQRAGLETGDAPRPGAIVVYQAGVQGASWAGHVAHVLAVDQDAQHFLVDEMNFPRAGVVTQRMSHTGPGVTFIY